ncbi:MAG: 2-oxoglutarate dehydrogenase complex dihydrolipoyllysine-residue succinyltransferase [Alphaproteobacteria bacterium]|nr:2-oxoglutarate dehydrogenase complex dihydrolipoyllysine-residue succinyltransferase [Alphaproteobacteria bacterium]MCB9696296.1 2-oxoglutarate dehydrogenase complex dihydrolipoyllysine-residue succinyltransferase [Alphaproteobacteria bacterium]
MVDVEIPRIGESIQTVFLARWLKKVGEAVREGEGLVELDSDKASMEVPAPSSGVLTEQLVPEGAEIAIGGVFARIDPDGAPTAAAAPEAPAAAQSSSDKRAGPAARQEAHQKGVDLASVAGTGPRGRVTSADVKDARGAPATAAPAPVATRSSAPVDRIERVPMTPLRRTIARRLVEAQHNAAMLTTFNEIDMTAVMALRKRYQDKFVARYGHKLGFMSFFVKGVIEGLKEFPAINAEVDGNDIVYKHFFDIGVAVSGPKGLVVPVVRDADQMSFSEVERAIGELAQRARDNKLRIEDFEGGTFTVSNGGVFGSLMSTPILNPPQVGILGMHAIQERPIGVEGRIELRPMMYVALSYDHRVVDGREAVGFLVRVKECVENPERILLEV